MASTHQTRRWGGQSNVAPLRRALVCPPVAPDEGVSWQAFGYQRALDHTRAVEEHAAFCQFLEENGVEVVRHALDSPALQDGIFAYDPLLMTDYGAVLGRMGKPLREPEVPRVETTLKHLGIPLAGRIAPPGKLEGGDTFWLDERTLAVGQGYRTNHDGIRQLTALLDKLGIAVVVVQLPHWNGPDECLHLLSLISPIDQNLAVAYRPLLPVAFLEELAARGITLIDIPETELATQGTNILALAPRRCLLLRENQQTVRLLEGAGCEVAVYTGLEISHNRQGGPTCLTQPLWRSWDEPSD